MSFSPAVNRVAPALLPPRMDGLQVAWTSLSQVGENGGTQVPAVRVGPSFAGCGNPGGCHLILLAQPGRISNPRPQIS